VQKRGDCEVEVVRKLRVDHVGRLGGSEVGHFGVVADYEGGAYAIVY
jgi:hypothetical protein